jgi:hypothetical protein
MFLIPVASDDLLEFDSRAIMMMMMMMIVVTGTAVWRAEMPESRFYNHFLIMQCDNRSQSDGHNAIT